MTPADGGGPTTGALDPDVVPARRPAALQLDEDGQVALYDPAAGLVVLNEGAAALWHRCDGSASLGDIVAQLGRTYATDPAVLRFDVWATYLHLAGLGLVEDARVRTVSSGGAGGRLGRPG